MNTHHYVPVAFSLLAMACARDGDRNSFVTDAGEMPKTDAHAGARGGSEGRSAGGAMHSTAGDAGRTSGRPDSGSETIAPGAGGHETGAGGRETGAGGRDAGAGGRDADAGAEDASRNSGPVDGGTTDTGADGKSSAADSGHDRADASMVDRCATELYGQGNLGDAISVHGTVADLGSVDYVIWGYSAGATDANGLQRFTNTYYGKQNAPDNLFDTGLWAWTDTPTVEDGRKYFPGGVVRLDFRVSVDDGTRQIGCISGQAGFFVFTSFGGDIPTRKPYTGYYEFECPDANIHVHGCFAYVI